MTTCNFLTALTILKMFSTCLRINQSSSKNASPLSIWRRVKRFFKRGRQSTNAPVCSIPTEPIADSLPTTIPVDSLLIQRLETNLEEDLLLKDCSFMHDQASDDSELEPSKVHSSLVEEEATKVHSFFEDLEPTKVHSSLVEEEELEATKVHSSLVEEEDLEATKIHSDESNLEFCSFMKFQAPLKEMEFSDSVLKDCSFMKIEEEAPQISEEEEAFVIPVETFDSPKLFAIWDKKIIRLVSKSGGKYRIEFRNQDGMLESDCIYCSDAFLIMLSEEVQEKLQNVEL